jgi:uncharacterized tellurite resistance protein B-like protein
MLQNLKELLDTITRPFAPGAPASAEQREHAVRLAAAVLLVEVMRADTQRAPLEQAAVVAALHQRFGLADAESAALIALAEQTAQSAGDYYAFTSSLNEHLTHPEKISLVESLWQVAYADAQLDAAENHAINKIAGLLHVTHGEYIAAKLHAKQAAGLL